MTRATKSMESDEKPRGGTGKRRWTASTSDEKIGKRTVLLKQGDSSGKAQELRKGSF